MFHWVIASWIVLPVSKNANEILPKTRMRWRSLCCTLRDYFNLFSPKGPWNWIWKKVYWSELGRGRLKVSHKANLNPDTTLEKLILSKSQINQIHLLSFGVIQKVCLLKEEGGSFKSEQKRTGEGGSSMCVSSFF